jgi:hypothetical protein
MRLTVDSISYAKARLRFRQQKIFRDEVKRRLTIHRKRDFRHRLSALLNSSFCLWFLSTIVAGSVTWSSSSAHDNIAALARGHVNMLDVELSDRLQGGLLAIQDAKAGVLSAPDLWNRPIVFDSVLRALNGDTTNEEYAARNFASLLVDLMYLIPVDQRPPVKAALFDYFELARESRGADKMRALPQTAAAREQLRRENEQAIQNAERLLTSRLRLARWQASR